MGKPLLKLSTGPWWLGSKEAWKRIPYPPLEEKNKNKNLKIKSSDKFVSPTRVPGPVVIPVSYLPFFPLTPPLQRLSNSFRKREQEHLKAT